MNRRRSSIERLEDRHLLASDWQNPSLVRDVDNSDLVTPLDVLLLINQLNSDGSRVLPLRSQHVDEPYYDVNGDNHLSPLDALIVINAINTLGNRQPNIVVGIAIASDPNGNGVILSESLTLVGQTLPGTTVAVSLEDGNRAKQFVSSNEEGRFTAQVTVDDGTHRVRLSSRDELGRTSEKILDVRRGNTIQDWNASVLDIVRQWTTFSDDPYPNRIVTAQPPLVARNLAMIHAAMFDAANAVAGQYESYLADVPLHADASASVAAAAAAFEVAKILYPAVDEVSVWQASLDETLMHVTDGTSKTLGLELGKQVGKLILADRIHDIAPTGTPYVPTSEVGRWRRTFPDYLPPLLPQWPNVKTFALISGSEFRPTPPPALDSAEYAIALDEVMRLGDFEGSQRTQEQTEIAIFWADGGGTATPPGRWNRIASDVTMMQRSDLVETARTFALLNVAMADAGIASWDAKYHYDMWRPIDAIRQASQDGNDLTSSNAGWFPLLRTPPFPTYTSGHSTFSGAASEVLSKLFGDHFAFESTTDGHLAPEQRPLDPSQIVTRSFESFHQAAEEAGMSRIYAGIHFSFDSTAGKNLGQQIGVAVMSRVMRPTPFNANLVMHDFSH